MINFPVHLLKPAPARHWPCRGPSQQAAIHIPLHPFTLQGEVVETSIRLDDIALDLSDLRAHENRDYRFPENPENGYIDGSLYLQGQHVPVDVTLLSFGALGPEGLAARLAGTIAFAAAGRNGWQDVSLDLPFVLEPPPTPAQIDTAVAAAIAATGASNVRDAGKLMAWLVRAHPNWDDRRALYERVCQHLQTDGGAR
ncbi:hypothetical protein ACET47_08505 [Pseudomonas aeruginosa]|uniref:hypothetical protein n=1 Tax=Pseudomonas aeruginosa TaxID=287 RepID=UPI000EB52BB0|nr:hypothetical protein [Pseudomonas aeruginosa]MCV6433199.1 hypothetical protein [Pseudomonas aeruginosa]MCV6440829.1 hypothetical protein [Pseudomonas aeruginosa]HBP1105783.1 hypothetical protein [Pseudomonas aeruginosa]HCE7043639.1 hypothetical protein [Pseudomonas aeruginosa]HCE7539294.1 hypothetical protein [Pseudomonas aeruginosa]